MNYDIHTLARMKHEEMIADAQREAIQFAPTQSAISVAFAAIKKALANTGRNETPAQKLATR
jgi:hypothetical protein